MQGFGSRRLRLVRFLFLALCLTTFQLLAGCGGSGGSSGSGSGAGGGNNSTPVITAVTPGTVTAGSSAVTLSVSGSGFITSSVVKVGGTAEVTTYDTASHLTATVPANQLTSGGNLSVVVVNGTVSSSAGNFEVDNPAPTISSVSPSIELVDTPSLIVSVTGAGFVPTTVININGASRITSYLSSTQVKVTLNATDVSQSGSLSLTAVNSTPGGGTSAASNLPVNNPPVGTIQITPAALPVGATSSATISVTGTGFISASVIKVNGSARSTTYVNETALTFVATVADQATQGTLAVTVTNPSPGGGTSPAANLTIQPPTATPVISSVSPNSFISGSPDSSINVVGTGFTQNSVVRWNGADLQTSYIPPQLYATVPAADLVSAGTAAVTVRTPTATPSISNGVNVSITNPPAPTLTASYPGGGPVNTATDISLNGTGFTANTTVAINGATIFSTFQNSSLITATIPASSVALPGNVNITVTTPAPGGGTSAALPYTVFLPISNNDIVYDSVDGLLYASVPVTGIGSGGNSVVGIDPFTGDIKRTIWVGSNPNKLALSTNGKQLFVGLDGAGAVAQVDLTQGKVVNQFSLGGGPGVYDPPFTALYLAAVPASPNSVAVSAWQLAYSGYKITIYDSGIPRANVYPNGSGPVTFGSSPSVLYTANNVYGGSIQKLTVDSTGVTGSTNLASTSGDIITLQYDNGRLYASSGQVFDASVGTLLGTFYSTATTPAYGPVVSDPSLGRAFIGVNNSSTSISEVLGFNESTFNGTGTIPVNAVGTQGYPTTFSKIVRWGQNGLAVSAAASAGTATNQIFIFQSPIVADLSSSPADVAISMTAPSAAATGSAISWTTKVTNKGPNQATGVVLAFNLDSTAIIASTTSTVGSCGSGSVFACDLGTLASGASATVIVKATPSEAGALSAISSVSSTTLDPSTTNNQASTSTIVSGSLYGAVPQITSISPNFVQAGSSDFTLTVNGTGFNSSSAVNLGSTSLSSTLVSETQLTAKVSASQIATYGWAPVTVFNPSPGGGNSQTYPLTIYSLVNVPASGLLFDPYTQLLYAAVPSTSTNISGNSVVTVDPVTGNVGTSVLVGSEPTAMAESADGKYIYISLTGSSGLAQYDPGKQKLLQTFTFSGVPNFGMPNPAANWLSVMPGTNTTLGIGFFGVGGIYDISGSTGGFRTNFANNSSPQFGDAAHLFTYDTYSSGAEFYRYSIDANGANLIDGSTLYGLGGFQATFQVGSDGLVYGGRGGIIDPKTTPPSQIASLPLFDFYYSGIVGYGSGVVADPSLKKEFVMMANTAGTTAYGLGRYDLTNYLPESIVIMPDSASSVSPAWTMMRWGQDGLALLANGQDYGTNKTVSNLILIRGPFVVPQELTIGSAATLASSSSSTLSHGSANTTLTLTGSNFAPGVAVTWNGKYRTTTVVDSTHVTVAIPSSDLAAAGSVTIVATNPGASASNSLHITIN
ncbi:MAG: transcription factor [Acidobacteria bacterium]|nr:transcription factor [Acidobacteriota bacterium]